MSLLRIATSVARRTPSAVHVARRGYAEASDKITFSMALPHQVCALLYLSIFSFVEFLFSQSITLQMLSRSIFVLPQVTWVFSQTMFLPLSLSILVLWKSSNLRAGPRNSLVRYNKLSACPPSNHLWYSLWRICYRTSQQQTYNQCG